MDGVVGGVDKEKDNAIGREREEGVIGESNG